MADEKKPGWKTTEFWTMLAYTATTIMNASGAFKFEIPADTVYAAGIAVSTYVASRSGVKAAVAYAAARAALAGAKPVDPAKLNQ